jgi:hypothetical protein
MGLYGSAFTMFIALEFSVFEMMLKMIEQTTEGHVSLLNYCMYDQQQ